MAEGKTCPYCGKAMEEGRIAGSNRLSWRKANSMSFSIFKGGVPLGAVPLPGKFTYMRGHDVTAWYCRECGKILVDMKE